MVVTRKRSTDLAESSSRNTRLGRAVVSAWVILLIVASARSRAAQTRLPEPARDDIAVRAGLGSISGRVTDAVTGQPVRKARVRAVSTAPRGGATAYTGTDGMFEFTNFPAGNYTVTAFKANYIGTSHGQSRPLAPGTAVTVADERLNHIDVRLVRAVILAGAIRNEFGQPLADIVVEAMRYQFAQGARRLVEVASVSTNDKGEFRLFGLAPGQYFLAASLQQGAPSDATSVKMYAPTYYPGTASLIGARSLSVRAGQTITRLNMKMAVMRPVRVSGMAIDSTGRAMHDGYVTATVRSGVGTGNTFDAIVTADGTFSFEGLPPGDYVFKDEGVEDVAVMRVTVGTSDISDLRLVYAKESSISGRVVIDPLELGTLRGSALQLATPAAGPDEEGVAGGPGGAVMDNFSFDLSVRPGHVLIRPNVAGWFVRAVRLNGSDITDSGFEIRHNQSVKGVEVELTRRQPAIVGAVTTLKGAITRDAFVVVFPQDHRLWGYLSRYVRMSRPDADSRFRIHVPPGAYLIAAVDELEPGQWNDPRFLERLRDRGVAIQVKDGDEKQIGVALISSWHN
jgi:hypothetical protein